VLVRDLWYESGAGPGFAAIHDRALFTIDGARIASPANQAVAAFDISRLNGRFTILSTHIDDRIVISGDGSRANVLALGIFAEQKSGSYFVKAAQPAARAMLVNARHLSSFPGNRSTSTPDAGAGDPSFITSLLGHTRGEHPAMLRVLPAGVTDVRMFRVWVTNGISNILLTGARRGPALAAEYPDGVAGEHLRKATTLPFKVSPFGLGVDQDLGRHWQRRHVPCERSSIESLTGRRDHGDQIEIASHSPVAAGIRAEIPEPGELGMVSGDLR
jgi:hypothetical protein